MRQATLVGPAPRLALEHEGAGPLVVCLHGIGGNRTNWRDTLPALAAAGFRAAAFDARGYGDSDDEEGPLELAAMREDVARVMDHFGAPRAHLVGLSMGGRTAADFAATHPQRTASLVLCDTHLGFSQISQRDRERFVAERKAPLLAGATMDELGAKLAPTLVGDDRHARAVEALVASLARLRRDSYLKAIDATLSQDLGDPYPAVRAPTLVVVGALDRVTPPKVARRIAERIDGAELAVIEGAGHVSNVEQPAAFNAAVIGFLSRVAGVSAASS